MRLSSVLTFLHRIVHKKIMKLVFVYLIFTLLLTNCSPARACSNLPESLDPEQEFFSARTQYVVRAIPILLLPFSQTSRRYLLNVQAAYKGCPSRLMLIQTPISSAQCGVTLERGQSYLLMLNFDSPPLLLSTNVSLGTAISLRTCKEPLLTIANPHKNPLILC